MIRELDRHWTRYAVGAVATLAVHAIFTHSIMLKIFPYVLTLHRGWVKIQSALTQYRRTYQYQHQLRIVVGDLSARLPNGACVPVRAEVMTSNVWGIQKMKWTAWSWGLIAGLAAALPAQGDPQWIDGGRVTKVHAGDAGAFYFSTANMYNPMLCTYGFQYAVAATAASGNRVYALLLSAQATGTPIWVLVSDTTCQGNAFPLAISIQVKDPNVPY